MRTAISQARRSGAFVGLKDLVRPQQLPSLAAWYDVSDTSSMLRAYNTAVSSGNPVMLVADKSGNSATNCLVLNGVVGNFAWAPDSAALSITGDIDLRAYIALVDWTPSARQCAIGKWRGAINDRGYVLEITATGAISLAVSNLGTAAIVYTSTANPTVSDYGLLGIRATRVSASGDVEFFTSPDFVTWTKLGATVAGTSGAIYASTQRVEIGSFEANSVGNVTGLIYRAQIYNGIAGTLVFDANFSTFTKLAATGTESSANAATVTINTSGATGARISGARDAYQGVVANQPIFLPWQGTNFGYCFLPGTRLLTNSGLKKVEEITAQDLIYQDNGKLDALTAAWSHDYSGKVVKLKARGSIPLTVTEEHEILVVDGQKVRRWKSRKKAFEQRYEKGSYTDSTKKNRTKGSRDIDLSTKWSKAIDVKLGDYVLIPKPDLAEIVPTLSFPQTIRKGKDVNKISGQSIPLNEELSELFGWWVAEGSFLKDSLGRTAGLVFTLCDDEMEYAKRIVDVYKRHSGGAARIKVLPDVHTIKVITSGASFARFVEAEFGRGSHHKGIPSWLLNAPNTMLRAFYRAYALGDGSYRATNSGSRQERMSTASQRLAGDMILATAKLGAPLAVAERYVEGKLIFEMSLNGDDVDRVKNGVFSDKPTQRTWFEDTKNYYVPIQAIEISEYVGEVYDFTSVTQTLGAPFIVHNCNGVAGNYFSTPDSVPLSITGDIDLRAYVALNDWTPAADAAFIAKIGAAGNRSYDFMANATAGFLRFRKSTDGTALISATADAVIPFANYTSGWVRVTHNTTTGDTVFYTSSDGAAWTQLGTTQVIAAGAIFDSAKDVTLGAYDATTGVFSGNIYRAQIYNGIAGTLVFDFNPAAYTSGTTFPDSAGGATITLNGGSTIVTRTCLYLDGSNDYLKSPAFALAQPETVYAVLSKVTSTNNDAILDGGSASGNSMTLRNGALATTDYTTSDGANFVSNTSMPNTGVRFIASVGFNGASSFIRADRAAASTGNAGTAAANGFTLGALGSAGSPSNITFSSALVYAAAHGRSFQDRVIMWLGRFWGIIT